ncbi:hypothetical protein HMPREF0083_05370 [Aneurinibacillus aneurinilyticus ATCC 12856]|uniref:Uncharacterized protein n=1 Tax=Aneurinibacillus aneurinilyticus ATCC 12856 TaxID=649747 RepID=U1WUD5_ANEAE|nr:hypothetical protein HMPREF0083_05370 [Aneurinibacillus aneurinilyticus ATCC 12856]
MSLPREKDEGTRRRVHLLSSTLWIINRRDILLKRSLLWK